jgi:hypothetical protein
MRLNKGKKYPKVIRYFGKTKKAMTENTLIIE